MNRPRILVPKKPDVSTRIQALVWGVIGLGCAAAFTWELLTPLHLYALVPGENYRWHLLSNLSAEHNQSVERSGLALSLLGLAAGMMTTFVRWRN